MFFNSKPVRVTKNLNRLYQISEDLDKKYVFSNLEFGQKLLELEANQYSSLVIKTKGAVNKEVLLPLLSPFFKEPIRFMLNMKVLLQLQQRCRTIRPLVFLFLKF